MSENNLKIVGIEEFVNRQDADGLVGKRFLIRADFNVPIENGEVVEDLRMRSVLPTVNLLRDAGAKIILISHIETKDGSGMEVVAKHFNEKLGLSVKYINEVIGAAVTSAVEDLQDGEVLLLQNLRVNEGEKNNDEGFAKELAGQADYYVNDAFAVSHRKHASVVGIPKFLPHFAGIQLMKEIKSLTEAINPPQPFVFILGGAKFETKLPLINKFIDKADILCIGGALSNDILKFQGKNIGKSLISKNEIDLTGVVTSEKFMNIVDVVVTNGDKVETKKVEDILDGDMIMDAGVETIKLWEEKIRVGAFVLWNGPLGNFELGFDKGTLALAQAIASSDAESIVGGGDTLSAIKKLNLENAFSFISTGGGATLDFLANETLPGIQALG